MNISLHFMKAELNVLRQLYWIQVENTIQIQEKGKNEFASKENIYSQFFDILDTWYPNKVKYN